MLFFSATKLMMSLVDDVNTNFLIYSHQADVAAYIWLRELFQETLLQVYV